MRILVTGGTGLLGNAIGRRLARAHQILVLSRQGKAAKPRLSYPCEVIPWDAKSDLSGRALEGVEAVIHLAGENIGGGKWTPERKKALRDSRVEPLQFLTKALQANGRQLRLLISASGVGFYGDRGAEELTEASSPGAGFLSEICTQWEKAAFDVGARRTVALRLGVVLSPEGGFVKEVLNLYRKFGAARLGSGQQLVSWIYVEDVVEVITQSLSNPSISGAINCVAPQPVTNADLTKKLAKLAGSFRMPPAPAFVLRMLYGEMTELLLSSQNVKPEKLAKLKWTYKVPDIDKALSLSVVRSG